MSLLLETTLGDLVIDLDVEGSPELCKNVLKLAKARYYTSTLLYNVHPHRFFQAGDPRGDGSGGACIHGLLDVSSVDDDDDDDVTRSRRRFLRSSLGRELTPVECREKGRVVATEMNGIPDTVGSQFLVTIDEGTGRALDGFQSVSGDVVSDRRRDDNKPQTFRSIGQVVEDDDGVLDQIAKAYCDADGRPYADIRIIRALVVDDPFDDPPGMKQLLEDRGVVWGKDDHDDDDDDDDASCKVIASPDYERPPEETVEIRIQADQIDIESGEEDIDKLRQQHEALLQREDKSRAVVLEMLGDLPSADIKAPENVLFVCKLNPVTEDEDLELIFSRFDENVKAEIIRDHESGSSLQYAFVEFTTKEQAAEAYFKMNNALVDDRRIKVDFSQSVAKVWDRFNQRERGGGTKKMSHQNMPRDPFGSSSDGLRQRSRQHHQYQNHQRTQHNRDQRGGPRHDDNDRHHHHHRRDQTQRHHSEDRRREKFDRSHASRSSRDDNDRRHERRGHDDDYDVRHSREHGRRRHETSKSRGDREQDKYDKGRSASPTGRRRHGRDELSESSNSPGDDSRGRRRGHHRRSRSRSRDRKDKKHKRKRDRRDESRDRRHKKHRKERGNDRKRRHKRGDDSSGSSGH